MQLLLALAESQPLHPRSAFRGSQHPHLPPHPQSLPSDPWSGNSFFHTFPNVLVLRQSIGLDILMMYAQRGSLSYIAPIYIFSFFLNM